MNLKAAEKPCQLSGFVLKVLAFSFMTLDHLGVFLNMYGYGGPIAVSILRGIGRLAFPLFVFLLAEGMRLSHHKGRYVLRLLLMYAIITIPETLIVYIPYLSSLAMVNASTLDPHPFADILFLGLTLYCLQLPGIKKTFAILPISFFFASFFVGIYAFWTPYFPYYLRSGYGLFGLFLALLFFYGNVLLDHKENDNRFLRNLVNALALCVSFGLLYLLTLGLPTAATFDHLWMNWEVYALCASVLLLFYSGKRGYDAPWWRVFSYGYFLLHMAVLYLIFSLI